MERKSKRWNHKMPQINGQTLIIEQNKLTEALELMLKDELTPEEVDQYLVADWN